MAISYPLFLIFSIQMFICFFETGLHMSCRLALNSPSSCLCLSGRRDPSQTCEPTLPLMRMVFKRIAFAMRGTAPFGGSFETTDSFRSPPLSQCFFFWLHLLAPSTFKKPGADSVAVWLTACVLTCQGFSWFLGGLCCGRQAVAEPF